MIPAKYWSPTKKLMLLGAMAGGKAVEDTATGNPLTFLTDLAKPLKSLLIPFAPIQEGSGDPSPENIRSIIPWNGLKVGQINGIVPDISNNSGMEKVNGQWQNSITDTKTRFDAYIQLFKGGTYIKGAGSKSITSSGIYSITFNVDDANCNRIVFLHSGSRYNLYVKFPFELPQGTYTISFNVVSANPSVVGGLAIKDIFLVAGSDVQRTENDISFPSPVYGGTLDAVTGVLTVEWAQFVATGAETETWTVSESANKDRYVFNKPNFRQYSPKANGVCICNWLKKSTSSAWGAWISSTSNFLLYTPLDEFTSGTEWRTYLAENNLQIVYELEEPFEIQLTPAQITALVGNNTIWSDADGSMTAVYFKKG